MIFDDMTTPNGDEMNEGTEEETSTEAAPEEETQSEDEAA